VNGFFGALMVKQNHFEQPGMGLFAAGLPPFNSTRRAFWSSILGTQYCALRESLISYEL